MTQSLLRRSYVSPSFGSYYKRKRSIGTPRIPRLATLARNDQVLGMTKFLLAAVLLLPLGPYDIKLLNTPKTPTAQGTARLVFAPSPFGVTVTADGRSSYDVQLSLTGLPDPSTLGSYKAYVAWAATTDLSKWHRLGPVTTGSSTVGQVELNKFMHV